MLDFKVGQLPKLGQPRSLTEEDIVTNRGRNEGALGNEFVEHRGGQECPPHTSILATRHSRRDAGATASAGRGGGGSR
jgi:hypothetical protein